MARTSNVSRETLIESFAEVFRRHGFEGASMSALSKETGLQKASLYHRFPGGKEEMAGAVLAYIDEVIERNIITPLHDPALPPEKKAGILMESIQKIYNGGKHSCLLNILSYPTTGKDPFADTIKKTFQTLNKAISGLLRECGADADQADELANTALMLLQGSLVLSRGMNSTKPFQDAMEQIKETIRAVSSKREST